MAGMTGGAGTGDAVAAAAAADPAPSPGRLVQARIYRDGALGRRPRVPVEPQRLAAAAYRRMGRRGWAYVTGSAGQQRAGRANEAAFERDRLRAAPAPRPGPPRPPPRPVR